MRYLIALLLLTLALPAVADEPWALHLYVENDGAFIKPNNNTDRHYTHGTKITFTHQPDFADSLADCLDSFYPLGPAAERATAFGYSFGQNIYTPANITASVPDPDDRPYAGWLYGGAFLQRSVADTMDYLDLTIGILGPSSQADDSQKIVHEIVDAAKPEGWDHQVPDEVGFNITYQRHWKLPLLNAVDEDGHAYLFGAELLPQAGFTLGTMNRHVNAGATLRAGWNLPNDFGPPRLEEPADATHLPTDGGKLSLYGFVRLEGRLVEHDAFIEGATFRDSPGRSAEPAVGIVQVGVVATLYKFEFGYSQTFLTEQFDRQHGSDAYGAFTLAWRCKF
ncbi:lipid A deacylase LpxR family protein [Planctomycetales bacterium ZRK34]|nr:lipid A deacylase LpxR family protein [Planctomycetales bacterium ZRK34]